MDDPEAEGLRDVYNAVKGRIQNFGKLRTNIGPGERDVLKNYGDLKITRGYVERKKLNALFNIIAKLTTKVNYDKLFHLSTIWVLSDNTVVRLEKNEVVNIKVVSQSDLSGRNRERQTIRGFNESNNTLNKIVNNTKSYMGNKFPIYDAFDNNCQIFVKSILEANSLTIPDQKTFILQEIYDGQVSDTTKTLFRKITNLANRADLLIRGKGFYCKCCGRFQLIN